LSSFDGKHVWGEDWSQAGRVYAPGTGQVIKRFSGDAPAFGYDEAVQAVPNAHGVLTLRAFAPGSMAAHWTFAEPGAASNPPGSMPLLADGYVFAEGSSGTVWALAPCTGSVAWQGATGSPASDGGVEPLPGLSAGGGYLVVPTQTGVAAFRGSGKPTGSAPSC
jgi:outer membrane protein assembly factor BamB